MHDLAHLGPKKVFIFGDGSFYLTETAVWGIIVAVLIAVVALWSVRKMDRIPRGKQVVAELVVTKTYDMVKQIMGKEVGEAFAPYMGTIFFFLLVSNMLGLFGFRPVTTDLNTTFALSLTTFALVQITAIRYQGPVGRLKEMASPMKFMFPIKVIEEVARPLSLGFRLFGNILGGLIVMSLVYSGLATLSYKLLSIPILDTILPLPANAFFDMFEPVLQAYIFTMLSMVYIAQEAIVIGSREGK